LENFHFISSKRLISIQQIIKAVKQTWQEKNIKHVKTSKQTKILGVKLVHFSAPDSSKKVLFNQDQSNETEKVQTNKKK